MLKYNVQNKLQQSSEIAQFTKIPGFFQFRKREASERDKRGTTINSQHMMILTIKQAKETNTNIELRRMKEKKR